MFDENAFGILFEFFDLEDEEYADANTETFVDRFLVFQRLVLDQAVAEPPGEPLRAVVLGFAVYLEFAADALRPGPMAWMRKLREALTEHGFTSVAVLSHGGRWLVEEAEAWPELTGTERVRVVQLSHPSEPLRRALLASAAAHGFDENGWGPGSYVDTEAIEALKLTARNAPTLLSVAGADFVRVGS